MPLKLNSKGISIMHLHNVPGMEHATMQYDDTFYISSLAVYQSVLLSFKQLLVQHVLKIFVFFVGALSLGLVLFLIIN